MQEEKFRFLISRNSQRLSGDKLKKFVIRLVDEQHEKYPVYTAILDVKKKGENRENIISIAERYFLRDSFLKNLLQLTVNIVDFDKWIIQQNKYNDQEFIDKAISLYGADLKQLVHSDKFKNDKYKIADSLIVASIVKPKKHSSLRSALMRARRIIFLLEYFGIEGIDNIDSKSIRTILKATILLPGDLFPLPNKFKGPKKQKKLTPNMHKVKLNKSTKMINKATKQINHNKETK